MGIIMSYCKFCGDPIEKGGTCTCEEALAHRSLFQKINKKYLGVIIGSILAVVVLLIDFIKLQKFAPNSRNDRNAHRIACHLI